MGLHILKRMTGPMPVGLSALLFLGCGGTEPSASPKKKSEPADATQEQGVDDASSTGPSTSADSQKEDESPACETLESHRCVPATPSGWSGPILPQRSEDPKALLGCDGEARAFASSPSVKDNRYVRKVQAEPAQCGACELRFDLGECEPPQLMRCKVDPARPSKCQDFDISASPRELSGSCQRIDQGGVRAGETAMGVRPGSPKRKQPICELENAAKVIVEAPVFPDYFRVCPQKALPPTCPSSQQCVRAEALGTGPRLSEICVVKKGEHACPREGYRKRRVLYGSLSDDRGCRPCEVKHEKGALRCVHDLRLASRDKSGSCENTTALQASELCLTEEDFLSRLAPWSILEQGREVTYSGSCTVKPSKPQGQVRLKDPLTLCCMTLD